MFKFILPIIFIGISITGFFLYTDPMYKKVLELRAQTASYEEALKNSKELAKKRDELTGKKNLISDANLDKLSKFLPETIDNIRLILELEKIAAPYNFFIKDIKYYTVDKNSNQVFQDKSNYGLNATGKSDYETWGLDFSVDGSYKDFLNFVNDLENNLRILDITSIGFSSHINFDKNKINNKEIYKYSLKIKTYRLKN
ncbi:MAG: hypothetical protein AAB693_01410 [Patescibacteria group bacterium]|mgnify:CR=1 FL=1